MNNEKPKYMTALDVTLMNRVIQRVDREFLEKLKLSEVYVAGNSLNQATPHDIDLYPVKSSDFDFHVSAFNDAGASVLFESRNATTVKYKNVVYQFCNYTASNISALVHTFDYSHIQVGVHLVLDPTKASRDKSIVAYTDNYVSNLLTKTNGYQGTHYPLSSMLRAMKYYGYGELSKCESKMSLVAALVDFMDRGFKDYDDFRDQLDAIDLSLVEDIDAGLARNLYRVCCERGMVDTEMAKVKCGSNIQKD